MQRFLLFSLLVCLSTGLSAQCSELFISEYVEGYSNNKAIEIYNPTSEAIDLSEYSIARFSNGSTTAAPPTEVPAQIVQLPAEMLAANDVFVVVIDMQDTSLWDSQFDKPAWDGNVLLDTIFDEVTNDPVLDSMGNVLIGVQYDDNGNAIFGTDYNEEYDLQCKADVFLCPEYEINRTMYFNGNDAVALIKGTEVALDGSNLIDVIGVIGEDPSNTIDEPAWVDDNGFWLTRDRTLVRKKSVAGGRNTPSDVIFQLDGTFTGQEWDSYSKNSFQYLGVHNSDCNASPLPDEFSCLTGVATYEINTVPFVMYPNPLSTSELTINAAESIDRVSVFNLMGQLVHSDKIGMATEQVNINLDQLQAGMYLVNLYFDDNRLSIQKLVVE